MASDILEPGFRLGKYEVQAHIATGGMGAVYKAVDVVLGRIVALKVLPASLAQNERTLDRFRREARHAAMLNHANVVTLFECGYDVAVDLNYLAMEFIDGIDLEDHIKRRGRLPPSEVRHILIRVTRALAHAHDRGMVHRDIKPSNILLARADGKVVVKLTDLGLARLVDDEEFKVTRDGSTVGTIDYLSPEQARDSRSADIRSDIYSLGCTAYHMLAGKPPFGGGGLGERIYKHMHEAPEDVRQFSSKVSPEFWAIVAKMLAKDPADRYQTPTPLLIDIKRVAPEASGAKRTTLHRKDRRGGRHEPTPTPFSSSLSGTIDGLPKTAAAPVPQPAETSLSDAPETESARAAVFHERAVKSLASGGGNDYARELLESCLALDPFNTTYRKTLRDFNRKVAAAGFQRWIGPLSAIAIRARLHQAKTNGQWRKVIEHGEQLLAYHPSDVEAHLEMAGAALNLNQSALALWLLQQGLSQVENQAEMLRGMARLYEERQDWKPAIAALEKVCEIDATDRLSRLKLNDLSAQEHLSGGYYSADARLMEAGPAMQDEFLPYDDDDFDRVIESIALPPRPAVWPVFLMYCLMLVAVLGGQFVAGIVIIIWLLAKEGPGIDVHGRAMQVIVEPWPFMALLSLNQLFIAAFGIGTAWITKERWGESLGLKRPNVSWQGFMLLAVGSWTPVLIATWAIEALTRVLDPDRTWEQVCVQLNWRSGPALVLLGSVAPAIFEEMAFRGYIQRRLLKRWPPAASILLTSLLFGILHITPHSVLSATILGIWLGIIAWRTDSVWPGALCHGFINAWALSWPVGNALGVCPDEPPTFAAIVTGVIGFVCFCLSIRMLFRPAPALVIADENLAV